MPDPYNLSAGRMIGTPYYSPRTSSALRRLNAADDEYDVMGLSDNEFDDDMRRYIEESGIGRMSSTSGIASSSEGGAPFAIINGKKIYMQPRDRRFINTETGDERETYHVVPSEKDTGAYAWTNERRKKLNAADIAGSKGFNEWKKKQKEAEDRAAEAAKIKAQSDARIAEARAMRQIDREFEDPNAAAMRAMQMRLMEAQLKPVEREAAGFRTQRERELDAQDKARANRQAQALADQIQALEATRNPQKMATATALRAQFAKQFAGSDVVLPGATGTAQEATMAQLGTIAPRLDAIVDAYAKPLFEREAQAEYQRSGMFGGMFTRNTAARITPEEVKTIQQNLAAEARRLEAETGVPAQTIYSEMLRKASTKLGFSAYEGTAVARPRVDELMSLLRGPWNDGAMR